MSAKTKAETRHDGTRLKRALQLAKLPQWKERLGEQGMAYLTACARAQNTRRVWAAASVSVAILVLGVTSATVDARFWRTRLSTYAENLTSKGKTLDALPFALAGVPNIGTLISSQSDRANTALETVGAVRVMLDVGEIRGAKLSANGAVLVVRESSGKDAFYDIVSQVKYTFHGGLGPVFLNSLSSDGKILITEGVDGEWACYDLANGGLKTFLGAFSYTSVSANGKVLATQRDNGQYAISVLNSCSASMSLAPFGIARHFSLSANGQILVVQNRSNNGAFYDIGSGGKKVDLGNLGDLGFSGDRFVVSADGSVMVALRLDGLSKAFFLENVPRTLPLREVGSLRSVQLSGDGSILVLWEYGPRPLAYYTLKAFGRSGEIENLVNFSFSESVVAP
jgi:WD40 repeat protein